MADTVGAGGTSSIDWSNNKCYVIINGGPPIHYSLVGDTIKGTTAQRAKKNGYHICPICFVLIAKSNNKFLDLTYHHGSRKHLAAVADTRRRTGSLP
jgi:hypothetical protein